MNSTNKNFHLLMDLLSIKQTFPLTLMNGNTINCKQLTTSQLKQLIKTIVDSPLTQATFTSTATKIFEESVEQDTTSSHLNIIDRLLFILETRIHTISQEIVVNTDTSTYTLNITTIINNLRNNIIEYIPLFQDKTFQKGNVTLTIGIPLLTAEFQLNEELYNDFDPNVNDSDELRKAIGDVFINEIAKTIKTIKVDDVELDLAEVTFKDRLDAIEKLPASLIQNVIEYAEAYKTIISQSLTISGYSLPVDGSLFSLN